MLRVLIVIPHYFKADPNGRYGSGNNPPAQRLQVFTRCLHQLIHLFGPAQCELNIEHKKAIRIPNPNQCKLDIVVATVKDPETQLIEQLPFPPKTFHHIAFDVPPLLLEFQCRAIFKEHLTQYDYFCLLEDDLALYDPLFFSKFEAFNQETDPLALLHPNRYELGLAPPFIKAYIDGDIRKAATADFQNIDKDPTLTLDLLGQSVHFRRPQNPHSGCYFLNQEQMTHWAEQSDFLTVDTRFVGPLESGMTLGIMRHLKLYKPDRQNANFLEVHHQDTRYISLIGKTLSIEN